MTLPEPSCETQSQSLVRDSVGTTITNSALTIVGILIWIAIARFLDPNWRGALALIMILPSIVMKAGTFGFDQGLVVITGSDRSKLSTLTRTCFVFGLIVAILMAVLFISFMWGFPKAFWRITQVWLAVPFMVITLAFPLHLTTMALDAAIYAEDRIAARNVKELVVNVVMLVTLFILVLGFHLRLFGVIGAYLLANTVSLIYAVILVRGHVDMVGSLDASLLKRAIKLGFPVYLASLMTFVMLPAMMLILAWELPSTGNISLARVGFFAMSYQMVDRIMPVTRSVGFALLPKITGGSEDAARELAGKAGRHTLIVSVLIFGFLLLIMHPLVRILLGVRYLPVVGPFWIMAPGGIAMSVAGIWSTHLLARCKPLQVAWAGLAGVGLALAMSAYVFSDLPPGRELMAASILVVAGNFMNAAVLLYAFCHVTGLSVREALIPKAEDLQEWKKIPHLAREFLFRTHRPVEVPPPM